MMLAANIEFSKRDVVLGDDKLASALIDRIINHRRFVEFGGARRWMEGALMLERTGRRIEVSPEAYLNEYVEAYRLNTAGYDIIYELSADEGLRVYGLVQAL